MVTVAIISEYNPFHLGHEYHIKKIREEFGDDTQIIAIMSGNYTQRGEIAFADKYLRAKLAVLSGVNLVLELPFPYSMSSAEFFASAGVHIANSLGCVDYLSFGSELGDIEALTKIAKKLSSKKYKEALKEKIASNENAKSGYPELCEITYNSLYNETLGNIFTPNNILALEYIKSLNAAKSKIKPHTVKRSGAGYNESEIAKNGLPSAMAIREKTAKGDISALDYIPNIAKKELLGALQKEFPTSAEKLDSAIISTFRLNSPTAKSNIHDAAGGLYNRLHSASFEADSIQSLTALCETKKYTTARIKRAIWYSYVGVTSSDVKSKPEYTSLLALDGVGRKVLKTIKKCGIIPIVTKPSCTDNLSARAKMQKALSDKADSVFQLTKPSFVSGKYSLLCSPFVKK